MAITNTVQMPSGTAANLATLASGSGLNVGQQYLLTDRKKVAVGTSTSAFAVLERETIVSSSASVTSPLAWNSDNFDQYCYTALANALTLSADAGSPINGQKILFRFKDSGTARALTWTTGSSKSFRAVGVTLPTTTVANKLLYVGCIYNADDSRWDVVAVTQEA